MGCASNPFALTGRPEIDSGVCRSLDRFGALMVGPERSKMSKKKSFREVRPAKPTVLSTLWYVHLAGKSNPNRLSQSRARGASKNQCGRYTDQRPKNLTLQTDNQAFGHDSSDQVANGQAPHHAVLATTSWGVRGPNVQRKIGFFQSPTTFDK